MILKDRIVLVTGANQGLGLAIAQACLAEGASLMLCARDALRLNEAAGRLKAKAGQGQIVLHHPCDVSAPAEVDHLVAETLQAFGHLDALVNNAGVYGPLGTIETVDWDDWCQAISINLMGTVYPSRAVLPHMKARRQGKIVNISGGGATNPLPGISAYAASKAAMVRFSETLAVEVKEYGIDVNAVAPGALDTRLLDQVIAAGPEKVGTDFHARMKKIKAEGGTPLSVGASCAAWLASPMADGITGRLIAAVWDPWRDLPAHKADLEGSDIYTLRRIVPKDRGQDWGEK